MEKKSNRKLLPYEAGMSIHERLHEIMVALEYLQKTHEVKFDKTNYRATTEEYVLKAIRPLIVEYHILVVAVGIQNEFFKNKSGNNVTHTVVTYRWSCVNSPDSFIETVSQGQGCDSQDKGAGTAFTYSGKYNLLKNLLIATGDDPDYVSSAEKDAVDEAEKEAFTTLLKLVKTNLEIGRAHV